MTVSTPGPYHHGDLPHTLRAAAVDVIVDKGLGAFSLREVARRAGVSHAAPGYHFGDVRGLLTAVAIEGFETLYAETSTAASGVEDPVERLEAIGRGYVRVGVRHPGHCEVMF
ncbi:MAG: TetR/AcrR family transcriptional regulator, partial [Ilumatobacter sp.]